MAGGEIMSPVARWSKLFSSLGADDILDLINEAIAALARDHPRELVRRCASIHAAAASAASKAVDEAKNHGDDNCSGEGLFPVREKVARINSQLVAAGERSDEDVLESLRQLQAVPMTFEALEATKVGRAVSGLRKHASEQVRELAGDLYKGWKALVDGHFRSSRTPPASTDTVATAAKAKAAPTSKPSVSKTEAPVPTSRETRRVAERVRGSPPMTSAASATKAKAGCPSAYKKRKEAPVLLDEAALAMAKRRLHDGYQEAATVRKQRMIQVIDAPGKAQQRPVVIERRRVVRHVAAGIGGSRTKI